MTNPIDPDDEDPNDECAGCGAPICQSCGGCTDPDPPNCKEDGCICETGDPDRLHGTDMPQENYERAIDDAIDDDRAREDGGYDHDKLADYQRDDNMERGRR